MHLWRWIRLWSLLAGLSFLVSGCGGSDRVKLGKVKGAVTLAGEPLKQGTIVFYPEKGRSASGKIVDGKIVEMSTYDPNDGAPLGSHKVTVIAYDNTDSAMNAQRKSVVPQKYNSVTTTDLKTDIVAGENDVKFDLKK